MSIVKAYLGIGSNQGERERNLVEGVKAVNALANTKVRAVSSLYCSAPVGYLEQADFLNAVIQIDTCLQPLELLHGLQEVENRLGRIRTLKWGPRTIDLDILLYGNQIVDIPTLQIPHPRMWERAFVMVPLGELAPDLGNPEINFPDQNILLLKKGWFDKLN